MTAARPPAPSAPPGTPKGTFRHGEAPTTGMVPAVLMVDSTLEFLNALRAP